MPLKLFVSYSHQDHSQLEELLERLRPLKREGLIEPWTDRLIDSGEDWREKITQALTEGDLGLFLFSKPFLASEFINDKELAPLLQRGQAEDVRLVPVLLRACGWTHSPLGQLNPLPGWDRFIENPGDDQAARDAAWNTVVVVAAS